MTLLKRESTGGWVELVGTGYENEAALQAILHDHPSLIPGVKGQAAACCEFQSQVGPADVVVVDETGTITIVECKLATNPQIRREVIGQTLDYASRLWQMGIHDFESAWRRADPDGQGPFNLLDDSEGRIREIVTESLAVGRFNLVLAVDQLNDDLKRIVEYLNLITLPSIGVIVVEFTRVKESGIELLIPRAYGTEFVEAKSQQNAKRRWTVDEYVEWCEENDPGGAPIVRAFLAALADSGFHVAGGAAQTPSLNIALNVPGLGRKWPLCMYSDERRGALIEIRFSDFKGSPVLVDQFAVLVTAVPGVPVSVDAVREAGYGKRPNIPARDFTVEAVRQLALAIAAIGSSIE